MSTFTSFKNLSKLNAMSHRSAERGFLLIEMAVAVTIILIFMTIAINERDDFARTVSLDNVAHEVALTIRQAQTYGISSRGSNIGDNVYDFSYGVYINLDDSTAHFSLRRYSTESDGDDPVEEEEINEYQLPSHLEFTDFCTFDDDLNDAVCADDGGGIVIFTRPNPDAHFFTPDGDDEIDTNNIAIVLENDEGRSRTIITNLTGYIYVE